MDEVQGIPVSSGVVMGKAFVLSDEEFCIPDRRIAEKEVATEISRLQRAVLCAESEVKDLRKDAREDLQAIFLPHLAILGDESLWARTNQLVREDLLAPETAVAQVFQDIIRDFESLGGFFADRYQDYLDIQRRILRHLVGTTSEPLDRAKGRVIVVAQDLTPSQTASLDRTQVIGFATDRGGRTSHTAIIARTLGIPAVVGLSDLSRNVSNGDPLIVDGDKGLVIVRPSKRTRSLYQRIAKDNQAFLVELERIRELPAETPDGHRISIQGNIEFAKEVDEVLACGGEGIGLYRTEFLLSDPSKVPDEDMHLTAYRDAVERLAGRVLTIRTFDFGADKMTPDPRGVGEQNPFLGFRSIRLCFDRLDLFKPQLRAILRASAWGPIRIMFPMISCLGELRRARDLLDEARAELDVEGLPYDPRLKVGIMIEIPSAALMADRMAREVDFFSIGTNDLIQYTLAVDRVNERVAPLYQPANPAILRLISEVAEVGRDRGVEVAICGEIAGETLYTVLLLGLGIRELSVTPKSIPLLKRVIRSITVEAARGVAQEAAKIDDPAKVEAHIEEVMRDLLPGRRVSS
jgi:phosphoenolpyruvate-protein phosphotransferase (PTS system enzyme I)